MIDHPQMSLFIVVTFLVNNLFSVSSDVFQMECLGGTGGLITPKNNYILVNVWGKLSSIIFVLFIIVFIFTISLTNSQFSKPDFNFP